MCDCVARVLMRKAIKFDRFVARQTAASNDNWKTNANANVNAHARARINNEIRIYDALFTCLSNKRDKSRLRTNVSCCDTNAIKMACVCVSAFVCLFHYPILALASLPLSISAQRGTIHIMRIYFAFYLNLIFFSLFVHTLLFFLFYSKTASLQITV